MLLILRTACTWSSIVAGLASAALWYRAATVKIKKANARAAPEALKTRAQLQSQYNQYAAFATAGAVALEALAQVFPNQ
jgi:hypothetical protein